jgi:hypothetical protein
LLQALAHVPEFWREFSVSPLECTKLRLELAYFLRSLRSQYDLPAEPKHLISEMKKLPGGQMLDFRFAYQTYCSSNRQRDCRDFFTFLLDNLSTGDTSSKSVFNFDGESQAREEWISQHNKSVVHGKTF